MSDAGSDWVSVVAIVDAELVDVLSASLWDAGIAGLEERPRDDGQVELRIGCSSVVAQACASLLGSKVRSIESIRADAGLDEWRAHAQAWRAGSRFVIVPPWLDDPDWITDDDVRVLIDPGHAFGSGSHETTRLCVAALETAIGFDSTVADVGCGSGVLSIIAAGLGASRVVAVDIDRAAVAATIDNVERNGASHIVEVGLGSVGDIGVGHDVVVANIAASVLIELAPELSAACDPSGALVLSGMLTEQVGGVVSAYFALGWSPAVIETGEQWAMVELRRPDAVHAHDHHHH